MPRILTLMLIAALFCLPQQAKADDVLDAIEQAVTLYKQGDFTGAAGNLEYAAQLVRQQKGGVLESFLPEPLAGWTASDPESSSLGGMFMGGGVSAERSYQKEGETDRIKVSIVTDSPMLQGMLMMFSNPMLVASSGAKMETIAGQRAVVDYKPGNRQGEVTIAVANRILVKVEGSNVEREDLVAYVGAMDFAGLAQME